MNWKDRITVSPLVCRGRACIKGTRIFASVILDNLADGLSYREIMDSYSGLTEDDITAALAYAAELARERVIAFT